MPEFKKRKSLRLKKMDEQRLFDQKASAARNRQEGVYENIVKFKSHLLSYKLKYLFSELSI